MARRRRKRKSNPSVDLADLALSVGGFLAFPIAGGLLARASMAAMPPDGGPGIGPTSALATRTTVIDGVAAVGAMFAANRIKDAGLRHFVRAGVYGSLFGALFNPTVAAARTLQLAPAVAKDAPLVVERV